MMQYTTASSGLAPSGIAYSWISPNWMRRSALLVLLALAACLMPGQASFAQVANRIAPNFSAAETAPLKGSLHPLAKPELDRGRASGVTKVARMSLIFTPSASQRAALSSLLVAQQNPASPSYHKWLTPAQYAAQFGMSSEDIATTEAWLERQGFTILDVSNGRDAIHFSGTVALVEAAFQTEMHQYLVNGSTYLANSTTLTLPSALAGSVAGVRGIAQFRPRAMHSAIRRPAAGQTGSSLKPQYTSSISGDHYLVPSDITTIYDIKALYNAGFTGTGQTIAIVGQTAINTTDIDAFRTASGLAIKEPTLTLVPNSGASAIIDSDDEGESDLDLEWSGAIAPNATVNFVYTGTDPSASVFDALEYAIDQNLAPIVSISYGECELYAGSDPATFEPLFMKANAQGQTILSAAGDDGATGCDTNPPATQGLSVDYPSSSPNVTAMGGTQFNEGTTNYWNTTNASDGSSAISYIPEQAWNETAASIAADGADAELDSTGGGASTLFGKPSWQVAANVPADGARDVPDISLDSAAIHDAFLFCSAGSCTNGFRDAASDLTAAGGTSFDAPIFAGILALIEQKNAVTGAGNINPELYSLSSTAANAFHDITVGTNEQPCASGSIDCATGTSEIGYAAGVGYDLASGLGSIDAYNLALAFPATTTTVGAAPVASSTVLSASTNTPVTGTAVTFTASVTAAAGTATPTGTVNFVVDGGTAVPVTLPTGSGTATYQAAFSSTGAHTIVANYSGDSTYAASSSTLMVTVASSTTTGSFTIAATNVSVALGSSVNSSLTIVATNGYSGVVGLGYSVAPATFTGCLFANDTGVGTNGTVTTTITVDTLASDCVSTGTRRVIARKTPTVNAANHANPGPLDSERGYPIAAAALLAGLALVGLRRKAWPIAMVVMMVGLGTLSGCGGSSGTPVVGTTSSGTTYTITLTGTDTVHTTLTASTTFTVTVQ